MINQQINSLKSQITKLQAQKEQLRLLLHELLEAFYKSISSKEPSTTWTFNPDLEALFKNLANFKTCSHSQTSSSQTYPNECNWDQMQDIFAKMKNPKGDHE